MPLQNNPNPLRNLFLMVIMFLAGFALAYFFISNEGISLDKTLLYSDKNHDKVEEVLNLVQKEYVDTTNQAQLDDKAIEAIVEELDPHSTYLDAKEVGLVNEQMKGNYNGIGVEYILNHDSVLVMQTLPNSPAEMAGVQTGDYILKIEQDTVFGKNLDFPTLSKKIRGSNGSLVHLDIWRKKEQKLLNIELKRSKIPIFSLESAYLIAKNIAYVKLNNFSSTTSKEFITALENLKKQGEFKHLILDLRDNPGGYLHEAIDILNQIFKEKGKLLVYTEGKNATKTTYESTGMSDFDIDKVCILIDEGSASASEIIAGAIQDLDRGLIIGRRSYGKGLVQDQYELSDGTALRLTIARYYTPSGRCIQKPYNHHDKTYQDDIEKRMLSGELSSGKIPTDGQKPFKTSNGRLVYANGGISPDIYIPTDTLSVGNTMETYNRLIPIFVHEFLQKNPIPTQSANDFLYKFNVSDKIIQDFIQFAQAKSNIFINIKPLPYTFKNMLQRSIKARIAKILYKDKTLMAKILNTNDPFIEKALENMN